jgi:hypothetical protein
MERFGGPWFRQLVAKFIYANELRECFESGVEAQGRMAP